MKFLISKLKTAFGNKTVVEQSNEDTYTEDIIKSIENKPYAISDKNVMYAALSELAGYHYFKTIVVGNFRIKTIKGARLAVVGTNFKLELKSDMLEIQSDFSSVSNSSQTHIDFEIDAKDLSKMDPSKITSLELSSNKDKVRFSIIESSDEEE
ncbi:hypothetical protein ACS386_11250 [Flavobacteriaceae bacterium LMO-SS05]